eukprot:NODE_381_length_8377_cov_0.385238.p3 type:complete len:377 gc:universal NODE_381_length_8377_cov_0.385238:8177-7047(-)
MSKESIFWHTQPVTDEPKAEGELQSNKTPDPNPLELKEGLQWATMDLSQDTDMNLVYQLLVDNYVSDVKDDSPESFRFSYSVPLLRWALICPESEKDWWIGIKKGKKLMAFITAVPIKMNVNGKIVKMAEVNFLCVHKSLRAKAFAPLLIKEITRRVHLKDTWQALYTAGHKLPGIVTAATYYHRSLNLEKLIKVGFAAPVPNVTTAQQRLHLKNAPLKLRLLESKDIVECFELFKSHNQTKKLYPIYTIEEFEYWLKPIKGVMWCYVVEESGKVIDFISYYLVNTLAVPFKEKLKIAYLWFYSNVNTKWTELLQSLLYCAQNDGFDVFNALEGIGGSVDELEQLRFVKGDGTLYYYLYNWKCTPIDCGKVGMFLL